MTQPFDRYPKNGLEILPVPSAKSNARHGYGLELQCCTKQTSCAYCGVSLVDDYYHWLLLSVDHVIPKKECQRLNLPKDWRESISNLVICCSACNGFDNHYKIPWDEPDGSWNIDRFFQLRNRVFEDRKTRILKRHEEERKLFQSRPWEKPWNS